MTTIQVQITPYGMAKEINKIPKPDRFDYDSMGDKENAEYLKAFDKWEDAEMRRKMYTIEGNFYQMNGSGAIYTAEILDSDKLICRIIS